MKAILQACQAWVSNVLVRPVPADQAVCEFDCRKTSCSQGEWETCERRQAPLSSQAPLSTSRVSCETSPTGSQ